MFLASKIANKKNIKPIPLNVKLKFIEILFRTIFKSQQALSEK